MPASSPLPLPPAIELTPPAARAFALLALGLARPHPDVATALAHHGFIQIDPINVCGRMHEHICRPRIAAYAEGDLHRHLHGLGDNAPFAAPTWPAAARTAFEHFHPGRAVLAAFPADAWPFLHVMMARRARTPGQWAGKLTAAEKRLADFILTEITTRGALASEHLEDDSRSSNGWNTSRTVKVVLDKLFAHGRLLIARRLNGRRVYDLPERILPAAILAAPKPSPRAVARWTALLKLRQHRLTPLARDELPLVAHLVQPLRVAGCGPLYCLRTDRPLLEIAQAGLAAAPLTVARLLAPLDPLILHRSTTSKLWGFDYTWEVYTPPAKRTRGYYALPLLVGDTLVGDVDLKADRPTRRLTVVSQRIARGHAPAAKRAVRAVATFLSLR